MLDESKADRLKKVYKVSSTSSTAPIVGVTTTGKVDWSDHMPGVPPRPAPALHICSWEWAGHVGDNVGLYCRCGIIEWSAIEHEHHYVVDSVMVPMYQARYETLPGGVARTYYDLSGSFVDRKKVCQTCGLTSTV